MQINEEWPRINNEKVNFSQCVIHHKRLGQLQKNFKILLRKLIRNCPPNHAITSTNSLQLKSLHFSFAIVACEYWYGAGKHGFTFSLT